MNESRDPATASAGGGDSLRVLLAAGGTGGHLMPALATAEALAKQVACEFLVVGSERASERELRRLVPYPVVEIRARALAGRGLLSKVIALLNLPRSVAAAQRHLRDFRPDLVIATGGYVCGPTGIAARLSRVPLLVLEQNATPGITTRWLTRLAQAVAVSFPETARKLGKKARVTGNPIRATLPAAPTRDGAPGAAGASGGIHLLVLGGSQGARGLNTMVKLALPILADADLGLRVTHQTGVADAEEMRTAYAEHAIPAMVTPFIRNVGDAYAGADLVCARAGATTLAEVAYCGLPSILVPFPGAAGRHQHGNAAALERAGAAVMVEQEPNGTRLADALLEIGGSPDRLARMGAAAAAFGNDDAAGDVALLALSLVSAQRRHAARRMLQNTTLHAGDGVPRTTETT